MYYLERGLKQKWLGVLFAAHSLRSLRLYWKRGPDKLGRPRDEIDVRCATLRDGDRVDGIDGCRHSWWGQIDWKGRQSIRSVHDFLLCRKWLADSRHEL